MRIAPFYLALALILLWLPLALFLGRRHRRELRNPARSVLVTLPALLTSVWSWVDLARAAAGTWVLLHLVLSPPTGPTQLRTIVFGLGIQLGPLLAGAWLQTMLTGSRALRLAPLFYLLGITAVILPWQAALFGCTLGLALTGMLRRWRLVFWIMPACLLAAAILFRLFGISSILAPLLFLIPALLGVRPSRPLAWVFSRSRAWKVESDKPRHRHRRHSHAHSTERSPAGDTFRPAPAADSSTR